MAEAYVLTHRSSTVGAFDGALTTVVSAAALSAPDVHALALEFNRTPIERTRRFRLDLAGEVGPDPAEAVEAIEKQFKDCRRCHLSERRDSVVQWRGNLDAVAVAIGEGPGVSEDHRGLPFVGKAGRLQDELLRDGTIDPDNDLTWLNCVACRPCDNRSEPDRGPTLVEKVACSERLLKLLRAIRPRVVLCLGPEACGIFFDTPPPVNTWTTLTPDDAPDDWIAVGYVRHPAYLLRSILVPKQYKEYAAAARFYRRLKAKLARLDKVSAWRFGVRYVETLDAPAVGG